MRRHTFGVFAAFAFLATAGVRPAEAKVARISLTQLARNADLIVIARVTEVRLENGVRLATAVPEQALKGRAGGQPLYFVAAPTWTCDSSTAVSGETVLLFLNRVTGNKIGRKGAPAAVVSPHPLYQIADSGRGRMPVRTLDGQRYVTLWTGGVLLPRQIKTRPDPDHDKKSSIRAALLSEITESLPRL